ncbi:MAG TPA: hypothetical protein VJ742_11755 [Nitrososphaera sp.]|nr:hypothetical protein [Nitrososphaera sp.]
MSAVRLAAVLGSLVALAILLSPVSPLSPNLDNPPAGSNVIAEEPIDEAKIAPAEITPEDFAECNSVNDGIQKLVGEGENANETNKIAADLLLGEYCNRPDLVHELGVAADPGLSLVAYACEAASGTEGDSAMQDSLADHTLIYCESARTNIDEGVDALLVAVEGFRLDFLTELEAANVEAGATYDIEAIGTELDSIANLAEGSRSLATAGEYYDASQMLDKASAAFSALLEKIETE